jgi:hypothetical protein
VLAWQINAQFQFDPTLSTEVEVRFIAEGANATRVELEHRDLERMGDAADKFRESVDSPNGWGGILTAYANLVESMK